MTNRIEIEYELKTEEDDDIQDYKKPWVGLTDEEYQEILITHNDGGLLSFYNLVEAKLRNKNA
jgi:hypothetical protein